MTYIRPYIYLNKQTSPIFDCVTPVSVSLATLARQIKTNTFTMNYTLPTYDQINNNKHIFIYKFLFLECITHTQTYI